MNKQLTSAIGGLAGAATLTVLNETVKRIDHDATHLDLLGMNALAKVIKGGGLKKAVIGEPIQASMAGDLLSNSLYFGLANGSTKKQTLLRGSLLGLGAGIGAVSLARPLGLDERAAHASVKTKAMTIAWYVIGGLVAAAVINMLDKKIG